MLRKGLFFNGMGVHMGEKHEAMNILSDIGLHHHIDKIPIYGGWMKRESSEIYLIAKLANNHSIIFPVCY